MARSWILLLLGSFIVAGLYGFRVHPRFGRGVPYHSSPHHFESNLCRKASDQKIIAYDGADGVDGSQLRIAEVRSALAAVVDPFGGSDIIETGVVHRINIIEESDSIEVDLIVSKTNAAVADEMKKMCIFELSMIDWVKEVNINLVPEEQVVPDSTENGANQILSAGAGLLGVKNIVAVSSCKGGVGKSTISVNLAYTLKHLGFQVGILDADIYGPSLPTMTSPNRRERFYENNRLQPFEYGGVKLMSLGFINQGAAIMRGPMVNQILNQFVQLSEWGDLDYLIIDMPPGTGDIQLTLAQTMNITAAVIVTTPQKLSFVDVVKGVDMFDTVNVPCVAVVENMAEYMTYRFNDDFYEKLSDDIILHSSQSQPSKTAVLEMIRSAIEQQQEPQRLFGKGHLDRLKDMWGIENLISIPLLDDVAASGDNGVPYVLSYPDSAATSAIRKLADGLIREVDRLQSSKEDSLRLYFDEKSYLMQYGEARFPAFELRCDCRCAVCVEELTGEKLLDRTAVPKDVKAIGMAPIGRYAISVDWSDGHKSLYPFKQIAAFASSSSK